jgi:hypothetical protein
LDLITIRRHFFIFKRAKIARLCISIGTIEVAFFFVTGLETLQTLGVEMSTGAGGSTESNVTSFVAFLTIYLSIITQYFIIKLSLIKKAPKKAK